MTDETVVGLFLEVIFDIFDRFGESMVGKERTRKRDLEVIFDIFDRFGVFRSRMAANIIAWK